MKTSTLYILGTIFFLSSLHATAQDDLLKQLKDETSAGDDKVIATFKGIKIINLRQRVCHSRI